MLQRMQVFLTSLLQQCRKYKLRAELIIVEWNPPNDMPSLVQALDFKEKNDYCPIRIITVPPVTHRHFMHADKLPLFQMIAKNVGIRRARGVFVLATNIDVIFSTKLILFLRRRSLQPKTVYRIDRTDVNKNIPTNGDLASIQRYCKNNVLRVCNQIGTIEISKTSVFSLLNLSWNYMPQFYLILRSAMDEIGPWLPSRNHWRSLLVLRHYTWRNFLRGINHIKRGALHFGKMLWLKSELLLHRTLKFCWLKTGAGLEESEGQLKLHTNACGDFTLLAKQDWLDLMGNPEWEMFSFHLDSVFCYLAAANGMKEYTIKAPCRLFHIEHSSGYTPKQGEQMYARIRSLNIPILTGEDLRDCKESLLSQG